MKMPSKGTLIRLFDAVVNAPKDAAYGLILPAPTEDSSDHKSGIVLTGALGAATIMASLTVSPLEAAAIGGVFAGRAALWLAAQGRTIRRGLDAGPQ